jgi:dTDP-4-dehydrorhamnose reductase
MNIAVVGATGNLGHELVSRDCVPVKANILDVDALRQELKSIRPEVVINCVHVSADKSDLDRDNTMAVNTRGPRMLLQAFDGKVIQMSTDFVFDGTKGNYTEEDDPNPINYYGTTKWGGEIFCGCLGMDRCCVVRTSWLYGSYKKHDLLTTIVEQLGHREPMLMTTNLKSNPTYIPHLADALMKLASFAHLPSLLHISGTDTVSRYQFAREVASLWHLDKNFILPSDIYIEKSAMKRPPNSSLNCNQARDLGLPLFGLFQGLVKCSAAYA